MRRESTPDGEGEDEDLKKTVVGPQGTDETPKENGDRHSLSKIVGRYEILNVIDEGQFGRVFKGRHLDTGAIVAIKEVLGTDPKGVDTPARLRRNFELVATLTHQHICKTRAFELDPTTGHPVIVMDFVEGLTLASWVKNQNAKRRPLDRKVILGIAEQIAAALDHAHSQPIPGARDGGGKRRMGILHRDLKPANIMVDVTRMYRPGVPWLVLVDFGFATPVQVTASGASLAERSMYQHAGNPKHMAPEQIRGSALSPQTDQWSLAILVLDLLYGSEVSVPNGRTIGEMTESQGAVIAKPRNVSSSDWGPLSKTLSPERDKRWDTCQELVQALSQSRSDPRKYVKIAASILLLSTLFFVAWQLAKNDESSAPHNGTNRQVAQHSTNATLLPKGRNFKNQMEFTLEEIPSMEFIEIEAASAVFRSGDNEEVRTVPLKKFYFGKHEVSNAQYGRFLRAMNRSWPEAQKNLFGLSDYPKANPDHPVVGVTFAQAVEFCRWIGADLPTEVEWQYVGSGGDGRTYPWGKGNPGEQTDLLNYSGGSHPSEAFDEKQASRDQFLYTSPIRSFLSGQSEFGAFNLSGNVREWCYTFGERGKPDPRHCLRGGSWKDPAEKCSVLAQFHEDDWQERNCIGFRVVVRQCTLKSD